MLENFKIPKLHHSIDGRGLKRKFIDEIEEYREVKEMNTNKVSFKSRLKSLVFKVSNKKPLNDAKHLSQVFSDDNHEELTEEEGFRRQRVHVEGKYQTNIESYLRSQGIIPEACLNSYLSEPLDELDQLMTWKNLKSESKFERSFKKAKYVVEDHDELKDIHHKDWDALRNVVSDEERKKIAVMAFKNTVCAEPGRNLTYHGFRGRSLQKHSHRPPIDSFAINSGSLEPLPGFKRKGTGSNVEENVVKTRKIAYKDLVKCLRSLYYSNFENQIKGKKFHQRDFDDFHHFIKHGETVQAENENFLAFYSRRKVLMVEERQAEEIVDMERVVGNYRKFYGDPESIYCDKCKVTHPFSV